VIAIGILAVIMSVAFGTLTQIGRTKRALDDERDITLVANAILGRMTRELQLAAEQVPLLPSRGDLSKKYAQKVSLIGESKRLSNGQPGDQITFMANDAGQYVPDGLTHAGTVQIAYRAVDDPDAPAGRNATLYLIRDEVPNILPAEKAYEKIMTFPITRSLASLQFQYFDGKEWHSDWDETQKSLPVLVKFSVRLRSMAGKISTYSTMVPLRRYAASLQPVH
jgi:hypothetical protein